MHTCAEVLLDGHGEGLDVKGLIVAVAPEKDEGNALRGWLLDASSLVPARAVPVEDMVVHAGGADDHNAGLGVHVGDVGEINADSKWVRFDLIPANQVNLMMFDGLLMLCRWCSRPCWNGNYLAH